MKFFNLELQGENIRVKWNESATFNIQIFISGEWIDEYCFTCYRIESESAAVECATDWINENIFEFSE